MTFNRSVGISAGLHLVILAVFAIIMAFDRPIELISESIDIRIRMRGESSPSRQVGGGEPSAVPREIRPSLDTPEQAISEYRSEPESISRKIPETGRMDSNIEVNSVATMNPVESLLTDISDIDPLDGFEAETERQFKGAPVASEHWSLYWSNGRERGILKFPVIDTAELPVSAERLSGVEVAIRVSPAGDVVSAVVIAPGSGDVRIDRYLNSLALELLLEPGFAEEGDQEGILRLVFSEAGQ